MGATTESWANLLAHLVRGEHLTAHDTEWAMDRVMTGAATPAQVGGFAVALRAKGETADEVRGMADAMLAHAHPLPLPYRAVDVVGTGGDRAGTVNISTMTALVLAAAGAPVVKHGNRAASSKCGTADVLEYLGVAIDLPSEAVRACVDDVGIGFCFAANFHPAFRHTAGPRRELGIPTAFNFLGPLTNPARPESGLIGCADPVMANVLAEVLAARGNSALVVRGDDGLDELTTTTSTTVWVVQNGSVRQVRIAPPELGIPFSDPECLLGGDVEYNAAAVHRLLDGEKGPVRDAVLLNAAGALVAYDGGADNLYVALEQALERVARAVDSGAAAALLRDWVHRSTALHGAH